jgi:signal transduction histidine kinase
MATGRPVTLMALIMAPLHLFPLLQGSSQLSDLRAALKAAEEMIQTLDVIVWVADIRTLQVYCLSYGAERILGYPSNPQSMDQDFLRHHIHPDDRERVLQEIQACAAASRPARLEYRGVTLDGQVVRLRNHLHVLADPAGHSRRLVGSIIDLTGSEKPESTPPGEGLLHEVLLRCIMAPAAVLDGNLMVTHVNKAFAHRWGCSAPDLLGRSSAQVFSPKICAALARVRETREECVVAAPPAPAEANAGDVGAPDLWRLVPVAGEGEGLAGIVMILAQETVPSSQESGIAPVPLRDAGALRERFLATVAHELRNPLTAMLNSLEVVRAAVPEHPHATRAMNILERSIRLQARLIEDLMHFSAAASGQLRLHRTTVDLHAVVSSAVDAERANAENASLALYVDLAPGLWVNGDADRLQQAATNLISNAIKYTAPGGEVFVRLSRMAEAPRSAAVDAGAPLPEPPSPGWACLVVEDTGMGISPELLPRLFRVFQRGEDAARVQPGLGVGLALVWSIVEMHGGRVWVDSEGLGKGSRFGIELPVIEPRSCH